MKNPKEKKTSRKSKLIRAEAEEYHRALAGVETIEELYRELAKTPKQIALASKAVRIFRESVERKHEEFLLLLANTANDRRVTNACRAFLNSLTEMEAKG